MPSQQSPLTMQQNNGGGVQGPRPATLKVTGGKRPRQPVIIYVESPKVVHAHPGEFKTVVQRLTGAPPTSSPPLQQFPFQLYQQAANPRLLADLPSSSTTVGAYVLLPGQQHVPRDGTGYP